MSQSPRLQIQEPEIRVLNGDGKSSKQDKSAVEASKQLQKMMLKMRGEVIAEDGSGVRYDKLKHSPLFDQYKKDIAGLREVDLATLNEDEKMAFFINIYNALTIHGLAEQEKLPVSVLNIQLFWKTTAYIIGGHVFSLDDIEHGILRGNKPHPSSQKLPFTDTDPRLKFIVKKRDPRIHFALVCGAKSCPAINVYTAENLQKALNIATSNFCEQEVKIYSIQKEIHISRIFQWYWSDFGNNDVEAVRWTLPYVTQEKSRELQLLLDMLEKQGMVDIFYKDYDWNLNKL